MLEKNTFYDINKFPEGKGLLLFPISLARIATGQHPKEYLKFIEYFSPSKIVEPTIGVNFIYGDFLYLTSDEKASVLKRLYTDEILKHRNQMRKILKKEHQKFQIQHAFNYQTWFELYLGSDQFRERYLELKRIYNADKMFQKYLREDTESVGRKVDDNQVEFFLEEHLLFYLISHGETRLRNDFIQDNQKWVLLCYPGKPMKAQVYLMQMNPFNINNSDNKYQRCIYDLTDKKLYDFDNIDLETWDGK